MSGVLQIKLRNYLEARKVLLAHYHRLRESAEDFESRENIEALFEYDQLSYSYNAIKSYYDISKSEWAFVDRQPFDLFVDLMPKVEDKLFISELYAQHKELRVLRRQLHDSSKEGGKLAHMMMESSAKPEDLRSLVLEINATLDDLPVPDTIESSTDSCISLASQKPKKIEKRSVKSSDSIHASAAITTMQNVQEKPSQERLPKSSAPRNPSDTTFAYETFNSHKHGSPDPLINGVTHQKENISAIEVLSDAYAATASSEVPPKTGHNTPDSKPSGPKNSAASDAGARLNTKDIPITTSSIPPSSHESFDSRSNIAGFPLSKKRKLSIAEDSRKPLFDANNGMVIEILDCEGESTQAIPTNTITHSSTKSVVSPRISSIYKPLTNALLGSSNQIAIDSSQKQDYTPSKNFDQNTEFIRGRASSLPIHSTGKSTRENSGKELSQTTKTNNFSDLSRKALLDDSSFAQFATWSSEYVRCIVNAAASHPDKPAEAIQDALEEKCKIRIREDEAEMLRLHYGLRPETMENYDFYIQKFQVLARQFSEQRSKYVTVPWAEMRLQFTRATQLSLEDWDIKGRYRLFLLHRRVYGKQGEPNANFKEEVEAFKKKNTYRKTSAFLKNKSNVSQENISKNSSMATLLFDNSPKLEKAAVKSTHEATLSLNPPLQKLPKVAFAAPEQERNWPPGVFKALVDGYCAIEPLTPNRIYVLVQYVSLKLKTKVELHVLLEISRSQEFLEEVQKRLPEENATSISKLELLSTVYFDNTVSNMKASVQPDTYYMAIIKPHHQTDFWDFEKTKSIMSTVEYASRIKPETRNPSLKVIRANVLLYIRIRLLREHQVNLHEETVKGRLVRMMELDMFNESQCFLLNEVIHKSS